MNNRAKVARKWRDKINTMKTWNTNKTAILMMLITALIAYALLSCSTITVPEQAPASRVANCDSCYQAQYLIYQSSATTYDTLMIWSTDTISADSLTILYSWFDCAMDTTIFDTDSVIFNQMKCN